MIGRDPAAIFRFAFAVRTKLASNSYDALLYNLWPLLPQVAAAIARSLLWTGVNTAVARSGR
jgi:hypothetical protein